MSEWSPIETAPKDGSGILGYGSPTIHGDNNIYMAIIFWMNKTWYTSFSACEGIIEVDNFTHWMPLPKPPEGE